MHGHGCWIWVWGPEALVLAWSKQRSAQQPYLQLDLSPGMASHWPDPVPSLLIPKLGQLPCQPSTARGSLHAGLAHYGRGPGRDLPLPWPPGGLCPSSRPRPGTGSASHFLPSPICGAWYSSTHMGHSRTTWGLKVLGKGSTRATFQVNL